MAVLSSNSLTCWSLDIPPQLVDKFHPPSLDVRRAPCPRVPFPASEGSHPSDGSCEPRGTDPGVSSSVPTRLVHNMLFIRTTYSADTTAVTSSRNSAHPQCASLARRSVGVGQSLGLGGDEGTRNSGPLCHITRKTTPSVHNNIYTHSDAQHDCFL